MIVSTMVTLAILLIVAYYSNAFLLPTNQFLTQGIRTSRPLTLHADKAEVTGNNDSPLPDFTDLLSESNEDDIFIDQIAQSEEDEDEEFDEEEESQTATSTQQAIRAKAGESEEEDDDEDEYDEFDDDDEIDFSPLFEDSPNFEAPEGLIERLLQREAEIESRRIPKDKKPEIIARKAAKEKYQRHNKDCGSPEVQIAMIHERIIHLTKHLLLHRKDVHCKRGLDRLVTLRRINLNYLFHQDSKKAIALANELGIRFTPPGRPWDRSVKYGSYKNTKKVFKITKEEQEAKRIRETQKQLEL